MNIHKDAKMTGYIALSFVFGLPGVWAFGIAESSFPDAMPLAVVSSIAGIACLSVSTILLLRATNN